MKKINIDRLHKIALEPTEEESRRAAERRENRKMHRRSSAIALKVSRAMEKKEMTNFDLAQALQVEEEVVRKVLSGKENMDLRTITDLEETLGVTIIDRSVSPWSPWRREQMAKWKKELEEEQERTGFHVKEDDEDIWINCKVKITATIQVSGSVHPVFPVKADSRLKSLQYIILGQNSFDIRTLEEEKKRATEYQTLSSYLA